MPSRPPLLTLMPLAVTPRAPKWRQWFGDGTAPVQRIEDCDTVRPTHSRLAVDSEGAGPQLRCRPRDRRIAPAPVSRPSPATHRQQRRETPLIRPPVRLSCDRLTRCPLGRPLIPQFEDVPNFAGVPAPTPPRQAHHSASPVTWGPQHAPLGQSVLLGKQIAARMP
jgi:hypothetical protein